MNKSGAMVALALACGTLVFAQSGELKETPSFFIHQTRTVSGRMSIAKKLYLREGKYTPAYKAYSTTEYTSGFHNGMTFALSLERDGTDFRLKAELKRLQSRSRQYAAGFYSALEAYHAISVVGTQQAHQQIDADGLASPLLEIIRQTKDADAKWRAVRALGNLRYKGTQDDSLLIKCLKDDHHYVRANAARALGDMRVAAASGPLLELLESEADGGVIEQTSLALRGLDVREAVPVLKQKAKHESIQTRIWVIQAIGDLGNHSDVPFLAKHLDAASQSEQETAIRAIENLANVDFDFPQQHGLQDINKFRAALERARNWWKDNKATYERR